MKGIYLITNKVNGNRYIGMSNNIKRRFMEHKSPKNVTNKTTVLSKSFRKYGVDNFIFEILEKVDDINLLPEKEIYWIDKIKPEYNMNSGGIGNKNLIVSEEVRSILKLAGKLFWENLPDDKKKSIISNNLKGPKVGHSVDIETRVKLRNANLGKKQKLETKIKIGAKNKTSMKGNSNGNKKVCMIKDGVVIMEFKSIIDAAKYVNIGPSGITCVLKHRQNTAGGYCWKYGV